MIVLTSQLNPIITSKRSSTRSERSRTPTPFPSTRPIAISGESNMEPISRKSEAGTDVNATNTIRNPKTTCTPSIGGVIVGTQHTPAGRDDNGILRFHRRRMHRLSLLPGALAIFVAVDTVIRRDLGLHVRQDDAHDIGLRMV